MSLIPNTIPLFFNISGGELFVIILFAIMFFGSKRIPGIARNMGKMVHKFRQATYDIQKDIRDSADQIKDEVDITKNIKD